MIENCPHQCNHREVTEISKMRRVMKRGMEWDLSATIVEKQVINRQTVESRRKTTKVLQGDVLYATVLGI
jgi:hypothetical protein